jgi:hypothetical protein
VTGYGRGCRGSIPGRERDFFLFATAPRPALEPTQSPTQWVPGALTAEVKREVGEADHSMSAVVIMRGAIYTLPLTPYVLMA